MRASFEGFCADFEQDDKLARQIHSRQTELKSKIGIAGKGRRLVNFIIDYFVLTLLGFFVGFFLGYVVAVLSAGFNYYFQPNMLTIELISLFATGMVYYTTMEGITGKTIGKLITRTKVVDSREENPSFKNIVLRSLCRFIPFEPVSFLVSSEGGWHDMLSNTKVVRDTKY